MNEDTMIRKSFCEYVELSNEFKEKEDLHDTKVAYSAGLDDEFNKALSELDDAAKTLHEKQADVYGKKHAYVYKCEKRRFRSLFVLGCFIPFLLNLFPGINGTFNFDGLNFIFNSLPYGFGLAFLDLLFFEKKNSRRYYRNYPKSKEGKFYEEELKQLQELEELHKTKLNAYNECVSKVNQNKEDIDLLKKEMKDIKYRMSRITSDYFRLMYEEYLSEEETNDESFQLKRK